MAVWPLLPGNELVRKKVSSFVYDGLKPRARLLLRCVYSALDAPFCLPRTGGYLDQTIDFLDALDEFNYGKRLYMHESEMCKKLARGVK